MTGLSTACEYIFAFVATKSFYNIEDLLSLPGAITVYGAVAFFGLIATYNILPETEKRTLEDIELHFSDKQKGLRDRKISQGSILSKNFEDPEDIGSISNKSISQSSCQVVKEIVWIWKILGK